MAIINTQQITNLIVTLKLIEVTLKHSILKVKLKSGGYSSTKLGLDGGGSEGSQKWGGGEEESLRLFAIFYPNWAWN